MDLLDLARLRVPHKNLVRQSNSDDIILSPIENVDVEILLDIWGIENLVDGGLDVPYRRFCFGALLRGEDEFASVSGAGHHFRLVTVRKNSALKSLKIDFQRLKRTCELLAATVPIVANKSFSSFSIGV